MSIDFSVTNLGVCLAEVYAVAFFFNHSDQGFKNTWLLQQRALAYLWLIKFIISFSTLIEKM